MQHGDIWRGIDLLAQTHGLSTSGLARLAGLDATAFNKSKRLPKDGRPRWPSTESISRVLEAVGADFGDFAELVTGHRNIVLPMLQQGAPGMADFFDEEGHPIADGCDTVRIPGGPHTQGWFIFEVRSSALDPAYQPGDQLIASRLAHRRKGDRIMVKPMLRDLMVGTLYRETRDQIELISLPEEGLSQSLDQSAVDWIARILWVSQ